MKLYMFRTVRLSIIRNLFIVRTLNNGICHRGLYTAFEQEHMLLLESCLQTRMTYTIVECTYSE